ncbi:hypothetical protein NYA30BAC_01957 [Halomonas sp. NYA30]
MQMHKLLAHPLFEEHDVKEVLEPFGFEVNLHFDDAPCAEEEPEAWALFEKQTNAYVDAINYAPPTGFTEIGRFVNEDSDITIVSVRAKSDFACSLLWSDPRFDEADEAPVPNPIVALFELNEERSRQVNAEGFSREQDDQWSKGELASLACCYADHAAFIAQAHFGYEASEPVWLPGNMDSQWWKPSLDPRRDLVKAGALILAEIERLDRAAARAKAEEDAA